ncbi:MAG: hypothetical protein LIO53_02935 [Oscillospiraceae bacterium]|nr:hypothetical protein [Oscillospiraceae bacterium]
MYNELYHHGIKGQRWGVQNGPPYPLNAKTANSLKTTANESLKIAKKVNNIQKTVHSSQAANVDLSNMSDKELKDIVNRMNLERQYRDLSSKQITQGKDSVTTTLSVAGDVLAITGSALTIALAIKKLKG